MALFQFSQRMEVIAPGIRPMLLLDNLSVHKCDEALDECFKQGMYVAFFPSNTTHFLQPEDDLIFGQFKKKAPRIVGESLGNSHCKRSSRSG